MHLPGHDLQRRLRTHLCLAEPRYLCLLPEQRDPVQLSRGELCLLLFRAVFRDPANLHRVAGRRFVRVQRAVRQRHLPTDTSR